jgi:demethylmenaquinone methyltransferase/2-methoxy-6-polyprenyl-1,4-benzoquinol methylase
MSKYLHEAVLPNNSSTDSKKNQVAAMFNNIAHKYDFLNRFMSGGIDIKWRKKTINELKAIQPKIILDVATGTGDVAILTNRILHPTKIVGIDISEGMLNLGKEKVTKLNLQNTIELQLGDSEQINFPNNHFDAVTVAYGVRNFENLEQGLKEILRVLKPGGKLAVLEASKPSNRFFRSLSKFYMLKIIPKFGGILSGNKNAYLYLNNSVQAFPEGKQFLNILSETGFTQTYLKTLSLGVCTIYCGSK